MLKLRQFSLEKKLNGITLQPFAKTSESSKSQSVQSTKDLFKRLGVCLIDPLNQTFWEASKLSQQKFQLEKGLF